MSTDQKIVYVNNRQIWNQYKVTGRRKVLLSRKQVPIPPCQYFPCTTLVYQSQIVVREQRTCTSKQDPIQLKSNTERIPLPLLNDLFLIKPHILSKLAREAIIYGACDGSFIPYASSYGLVLQGQDKTSRVYGGNIIASHHLVKMPYEAEAYGEMSMTYDLVYL